jgi:hypothetical protein
MLAYTYLFHSVTNPLPSSTIHSAILFHRSILENNEGCFKFQSNMAKSRTKSKDKVLSSSSLQKDVKDHGDDNEIDFLISPLRVTMLGLILLTVGAFGFYYLPGMISEGASGSRIVNSFYCSAITLTT